MKAVILAGGLGTRLSEETVIRPKPMVEIGGMPILWHILKSFSQYGIDEFIICCGYKGSMIKEWFHNYSLHRSDVTFDMRTGGMEVHSSVVEPWRVTLVDTGEFSMTGGRLKRVAPYLADEEDFFFTYGDGLSNVNIDELLAFHRAHGGEATLTAVQPPGRFGALGIDGAAVTEFQEKPVGDGGWINGGFFVLKPSVLDRIEGDATHFEADPLKRLAKDGELFAFQHDGFWQSMDTLRDRNLLESLWNSGQAPWATWLSGDGRRA